MQDLRAHHSKHFQLILGSIVLAWKKVPDPFMVLIKW